jgi:Fe-S oxidoreductase
MINFNLFVLPFFLGLIYVILFIARSFYIWIKALPPKDKIKLAAGLRSPKQVLGILSEIFMEALIHRKMWKQNPLLGYMHMSFALGWFLLIVLGNLESRIYSGTHLNAPYYPIFLKFFIHDRLVLFFEIYTVPAFFRFIMDLLLLFVLSGLVLAFIKRQHSKWFGMRKTTEHLFTDRIALTCLWMIFPLRLLAESYTAGFYQGGGGFMTQPLGNLLVKITPFPSNFIAYGLWWGYSLALGIFFILLPYSRYMHIPTELLLIVFRHCNIQPKKWFSSYSDVEIHACSRCGVCIDVCQLRTAGITDSQSVYFIRDMRDQFVREEIAHNCLLCGRCQETCPVGIKTDSLRMIKRREFSTSHHSAFTYLEPGAMNQSEVLYFAGCMSHLTPSITRSMVSVLNTSGISFQFLDKDRSVCCGRPLMLNGKDKQANELIEFNKYVIRQTRAKLLVTSCPICYRIFREEYNLPIQIQHHTQFLLDLSRMGKIPVLGKNTRVAYHDPCDLGRGCKVYDAPRELLEKIASLVQPEEEKNTSFCCGGSLGIFSSSQEQRDEITKEALGILLKNDPEILVTACPLCKKTFSKLSPVKVMDIAELVCASVPDKVSAI